MIELQGLTKTFDDMTAVDRVTLTIPAGQICGYLGPNGAGKTTTVKMLTGMLTPTEGSASVAGFDVQADELEVKKRIGYVPESGALYESLTPFEYLQFVGRLYDMRDDIISERIDEFCSFFGIKESIDKRMSEFSKGMKQKVVISAALLHNPDIIFMDEPLNGLDANSALVIKKLIQNLAAEGKTVFYCSHILDVVENLCERVVIINEGKIAADGSVDELKNLTEQSSLEAVFSRLTHAEDAGELAAAFSKTITGSKGV